MPDTFGSLRSYVDDLAGLDLTPDERDRLLTEGHRRLCLRAEWTRLDADLGPTVKDQAHYPWPTSLDRILSLWLGNIQYDYSSYEAVRGVLNGSLSFSQPYGGGLYYAAFPSGERSVGLFPVPGEDGLEINIRGVDRPALMTDDADIPAGPPECCQASCDYATAMALGSAEDLDTDREFFTANFERAVQELRTLGIESWSQGPAKIAVAGYDFPVPSYP